MLTDRNLNLEEKVRELRETVGDLVREQTPDFPPRWRVFGRHLLKEGLTHDPFEQGVR